MSRSKVAIEGFKKECVRPDIDAKQGVMLGDRRNKVSIGIVTMNRILIGGWTTQTTAIVPSSLRIRILSHRGKSIEHD